MIYLVLVTIGVFFATLLGGLFALRFKDKLHLISGFSAGAVIGLVFFDLLPESFSLMGDKYDFSTVSTIMAGGFVLYLILDRFLLNHHHDEEVCEKNTHEHTHKHSGALGAGSLSIHSFLDGLAVGVAFQVSNSLGLIVAVAVLAHDFSDGINTVNFILKNGGNRRSALKWLLSDSIAPVLGIIVGSLGFIGEGSLGIILSVFCGFFLYIGASELLPESYHNHPTWWTTAATILGVLTLYLIIKFAAI